MKSLPTSKIVFLGLWLFVSTPLVLAQNNPSSWTRQFGTADDDFAFGTAYDATSVYVAGYQHDSDMAPPNPCRTGAESLSVEAFLRKYTSNGGATAGFSFTPTTNEIARAVTVDGGGNVYVAGENVLTGMAFLRKYGPSGGWNTQFAPPVPFLVAVFFAVAVNASGVYVAGHVDDLLGNTDVIVRAYDLAMGTQLLWSDQFGGLAFDSGRGVAADATGIYVVGYTGLTNPSTGSAEAFVRKYDVNSSGPSPTPLWTNQINTSSDDFAFGVAATGAAVYVGGFTLGSLTDQANQGLEDAFVRAYKPDGTDAPWTQQFGTSSADFAVGVAATSAAVYVAGFTGGQLPGQTALGQADAYVRKYDSSGSEMWTTQFGTAAQDAAWGVATDGTNVYAAGCTNGILLPVQAGGPIAKDSDAFLVKNPQFRVNVGAPNGGSSSTIRLGSNGVLPVAIFSTAAFDATTVDPTSITLAGATVKLKGNGTYQTSLQDVNGDGRPDLVVQVLTEALQLSETDTEAVLEGMTVTGQAIRGKHLVRIVP